MNGLPNNKEFENVSSQVIDVLVDSTLRKHGVKLQAEKIGQKEKEELVAMIETIKKSVDQLTKKVNEKKD